MSSGRNDSHLKAVIKVEPEDISAPSCSTESNKIDPNTVVKVEAKDEHPQACATRNIQTEGDIEISSTLKK